MAMHVRRVGWVVVFAGIAMGALGLVSLGEWAAVAWQLHAVDVVIDFERADTLAELLPFNWHDDVWLQRAGLVTVAAAVGGLLLSWKFPRAGAALVFAGLISSVVLALLYVGWSMTVGTNAVTNCGPDVIVPTAHDFIDVRRLAVLVSLVAAAALVRWGRSREALISGAVLLVMVSAPLLLEAFEARVVIIASAFFAFSLTRWFEVDVQRFAVALSIPVFIAGAWSTVVVAHDARAAEALQEGHESGLWWHASEGVTTFVTERCEETPLTVFARTHDGFFVFPRQFWSPVDAAIVTEAYEEVVTQRESLGAYGDISMNIEADRELSLADFFALIRGFHRVEATTNFVTLTFMRQMNDPLWSRPSIHAHTCGLRVQLSADGLRERDFANFEAVFEAASRGGLKLSVE